MDLVYTRIATVLFKTPPGLDVLKEAFAGHAITPADNVAMGGFMDSPGFDVIWNSSTGESARVDYLQEPWPLDFDAADIPERMLAWSLGAFGSSAPLSLTFAKLWAQRRGHDVEELAAHTGVCRIRLRTGARLTGEDKAAAPIADQLFWLAETAGRLARLPGAAALFMPESEALLTAAEAAEDLAHARSAGGLPLQTLISVRVFDDAGWQLLSTVGMHQFKLPDVEYAAPRKSFPFSETALTLLNTAHYLITRGDVINTDNTVDGVSGQKWRALRCQGAVPPAGAALRLTPDGAPPPPQGLMPLIPTSNQKSPGGAIASSAPPQPPALGSPVMGKPRKSLTCLHLIGIGLVVFIIFMIAMKLELAKISR